MRKTIFVLALLLFIPVVSANAESNYTVVKGDTLWGLSYKNGITLESLRQVNNKWDDLILIGQNLIIPNRDEYNAKNYPVIEGRETVSTPPKQTSITQKQAPATTVQSNNNSISSYEKDLLARLVRAEAQGEPYAGKVAVARVVLNRVESSQFPNTIKGVIYQSGQFSPVSNGSITKPASSEDFRVVEDALSIGGSASGSLFFYNPAIATSRWLDSRPTTEVIGNHTFKR
jgi:N-acetylmuramoyl-L-alanine amidase